MILPARFERKDNHVTKIYHLVFLGMCIGSFIFSICTASFGIWFVFRNPDKQIATVAVEAISALGFFFARWSQLTFIKLYQEAAFTESVALFAGSGHMQANVAVFQEFMRSVMSSRGTVLTNAKSVKNEI